jgi:glycosyltransferase involved in cell wall biosynthesis
MIMTLNEVNNIEGAIKSWPPGTRIVVYDSFSTDGTVEKAKALGAKVVQRKFDNWSAHQTWGAHNIEWETPWVWYTDADEHMTPGLWKEICTVLASSNTHAAYDVRRKDIFLGRWIKRSSFYPCWFTRLYRPKLIHWERLSHPVAVVQGTHGRLQEHFMHYPFSKSISSWFERHIGYAQFEAQELMKITGEPIGWSNLFGSNRHERRRTIKKIFYRLPFRPLIKFFVLYVLRRGFLDGRAGFHYAIMQSVYEYMITLHHLELKRKTLM